jgi:hypothetical protein
MPLKTGATVISDCRLPSGLSHKEADARRLSPEPGPGPGTPLGATILTPDPRNILPRAETPTKAMFLRVGDKAYEVASFAQASQMFCIARDKNGEGASNTPSPLIVDNSGSAIAHVSYNGRVWPGDAWTVDAMPLYDNRME